MYFYVTYMYVLSIDFITNKNAIVQMHYLKKNERFRMEKCETSRGAIWLKDENLFPLWFKTQKNYKHVLVDKST